MSRTRVLIVDDSVVTRSVLQGAFADDPEIEVVGAAENGKIGVQKFIELEPDIVILDIEMPEMNGLEAIVEIRKHDSETPIIMFSTLTEHGAKSTFEALSRGATDYVQKPSGSDGLQAAQKRVRSELIPKIQSLTKHGAAAIPKFSSLPKIARKLSSNTRIDLVCIGVSTGGPNALAEVIPALPLDLGVPVVICQHMPPMFTQLLAERLDKVSPLTVREGVDGKILESGHVWIAPGGKHMVVDRKGVHAKIRLNEDPPENSCRPAVDPLFRSVTKVYGAHALGVMLTGMGSDGLSGCGELCHAGAEVIAQDEATSVVWGMPGAVVQAELASVVLPLKSIGEAITRRVKRGRV